MELLARHYNRVQTLQDWLCRSLEDEGHVSSDALVQDTDYECYERLLTYVYVCEDTDKCTLPSFSLSHYHQQKEIVLTAIERILSKKGYGKNVLTYGFCLMSPDPFALSCGVNVESRYPNSSVNRLYYPAWETLLSRTGDAVMMFLLEHTSLFYQVTSTCMVQISGAPINNLTETAALKTKTTPKTNQIKIGSGIEPNSEGSKYKLGEFKIDKVQKGDDSNYPKESISRKDCILSKINSSRKVVELSTSRKNVNLVNSRNVNELRSSGEIGDSSSACREKFEVKCIDEGDRKKEEVGDLTSLEQSHLASSTNKRCKTSKRKNKKSDMGLKRKSSGYKKRKFEDIDENRFLELKRFSIKYARREEVQDTSREEVQDTSREEVQDTSREEVQDTKPPGEKGNCSLLQENCDEINPRKRKLEDVVHIGKSDEMKVIDQTGKRKRILLQPRSNDHTEWMTNDGSDSGHEKECKKDMVESAAVESKCIEMISKERTTSFPTFTKTANEKRKLKKRRSKMFKEKDACRSFCPFEFHIPLQRNYMLFSRNPRERFTKSVLLSRLDTTPENIIQLYQQIFCETKVLSDTEAIRFTSPDVNDIQMTLGTPRDKQTAQSLEGDGVQSHDGTVVNGHPSFWNDSSKKRTFLSDLSGTCVPTENSHICISDHELCQESTSSSFNKCLESDVLPTVITNHDYNKSTVGMGTYVPCKQGVTKQTVEPKLQGENAKSVKSVGTVHCLNGITSCAMCKIRRCGKEALLAERKHEIILIRKNAELDRYAKGDNFSPTPSNVLSHHGKEVVEENKNDRNCISNHGNSTSYLSPELETTRIQISSVQNTCLAIQEISTSTVAECGKDLYVATSQLFAESQCVRQNSAQHQCTSQQSAENRSTSQHSAQIVCSNQHAAENMSISQHLAQKVCTSQHSGEECTSQQSVQCTSRQPVDIPVFKGIVPLLKRLIERHQKCPFRVVLNHYCPSVHKKKASNVLIKKRRGLQRRSRGMTASQLLSNHHHHREVYLFLRACIVRVLPVELLGTRHNFNILLKNISKLVSLGKYERLTVGQVMHGIKTSEVDWLSNTGSNSTKLHMLARLIVWLFSYVLAILKTFFYITDTGFLRYKLLYYRQVTWNRLHCLGINGLISRKILKIISEKKALEMLQGRSSLGVSLLRFLPKQQSLRPIINMGSAVTLNSYRTQPVNKQLSDLHSILTYLKTRNPSLIGHGKLGTDDIYMAWKSFVQQWRNMGSPKLHFVKTDISNCYDSIRPSKLYAIMEDIFSKEMSDEEFVIRKYLTVVVRNGSIQRKFHRVVTPMSEFNPDFLSYSKRIVDSNKLRNVVFVDKVVYQHETSDTLLKLLKQHLFNNLIKVGNHYYLQTCGISQGSVISTLLCSFYYADMEKNLFELNKGEFLMRIVDDYFYVTPSQEHAISFLETMVKGIPAYNCCINKEKILTNFTYDDDCSLPSISAEWFPWCGLQFNTNTLEVSMDFSKNSGFSVRDTMTMELSKAPGKSLKEKLVFLVRQKCHALFIDMTINSEKQMLINLYLQFLLAVFKLHAYIQKLHYRQRAESNPKYFLGVIRNMIQVVDCVVRKHLGGKGIDGKDIPNMVNWLCLKACCVKFSSHRSQYKRLLKELKKQLKHKQECLTSEEEALLSCAVEHTMPEAFQSFLS